MRCNVIACSNRLSSYRGIVKGLKQVLDLHEGGCRPVCALHVKLCPNNRPVKA